MIERGTSDSILEVIGDTPLVKLSRFGADSPAMLYGKLEYINPMGSVKDRIALQMVKEAEETGLIDKDTVIIEPTSGNTGIGLAMVGAVKGYKVVVVAPEPTINRERLAVLQALGAEVITTPESDGFSGSFQTVDKLKVRYKKTFIPQQFENQANVRAHYRTGWEILNQTNKRISAFVAGVGTGGTITGVGRVLKQELKDVEIVLVEPSDSPFFSEGVGGPHSIHGIGPDFEPDVLDIGIVDTIVTVTEADAVKSLKRLAKEEAVFCGVSAGAAAWAGLQVAHRYGSEEVVVAVLPDTGHRYFSRGVIGDGAETRK